MICLCSYSVVRCPSVGLLEVLEHHDHAVVRRRGTWTIVESASVKATKEELSRINEELERRGAEGTEELGGAPAVPRQVPSAAGPRPETPPAGPPTLHHRLLESGGGGARRARG